MSERRRKLVEKVVWREGEGGDICRRETQRRCQGILDEFSSVKDGKQ